MIQYQRYFNEWEVPSYGIDTISIWIHPNLISRFEDFHERGNIHEAINCRRNYEKNQNTGQIIRTNYIIDFQTEAINPDYDILEQIIQILSLFVYDGTLKMKKDTGMPAINIFFMEAFSSLFSIDRIDFYFDLKDNDIIPSKEPDPGHPNTYYSSDYPSSIKTYSRIEKLKSKNNISYQKIMNIEFNSRIEFHLCRSNCDFLDYRNLQGNFEIIFLRYLPLLAKKLFKHRREILEIPYLHKLPYAHHLRQIHNLTFAGHIPQYKDLLKSPTKPIPYKKYKKNETDYNWLSEFEFK